MQLVLSHVGTDFDGLASMVLAQKLYPGSELVFPGRKSGPVKEFYDLHKRHFPSLPIKKALSQKPTRLIVVDTRTPSRLGEFRQWLHHSDVELHIYDHHPPTSEAVRGDQEWVEQVGAAATLLIERCRAKNLSFSPEEASLGLIAIHEETGSFRYASTTHRDLQAAAFLMEQGANLEVVSDFLKDPLSDAQRALLEDFLKSGKVVKGPAGRAYIAAARRQRAVFGLGLLANQVLEIEGSDAVCLVLDVPGQGITIGARSTSDAFNVADWMTQFGGGGHTRAASASQVRESIDEVTNRLSNMVCQSDSKSLKAADLMSTDLFTIDLSYTVRQAYDELVHRGFHSACVLDETGKLQGLVSRTDLTRALDHDLGHAPARSVMTHKVVSVEENSPIAQVRRLVVERNVGSLPVLRDGELVGILTRTDLLRQLYQEDDAENWSLQGQGAELDLNGISEPFLTWLSVTARMAALERTRLYAVGGFVRDLLLGRSSEDLDLMVEGDAISLASKVAKELNGKLVQHEKYLTASIKFEDGSKLDLATARREVYVRPAALPEVAQSKLKSDLYRRDFTINSLALKINDQLRGTVVDFFGGRQDLDGKKIRVLHNHSFLDDPTRILRAVRFEQRLGFQIEPHTAQLIRSALEADIFDLAHGERLAEELRLSLSESDPLKVLSRLHKLRILRSLTPNTDFNRKLQDRIARGMEFVSRFPGVVPDDVRWLIPLNLMGSQLNEEQREELTQRFGWRIARFPSPVHAIVDELARKDPPPSRVAELLEPLRPQQLAVVWAIGSRPEVEDRMADYLTRTRHIEPLIKGHHILEAGIPQGPDIAVWKNAALAAQRDGLLTEVEEAKAWLEAEIKKASLSASEASRV